VKARFDQAVYAYVREDLDGWQAELGRALHNGVFGENLTTVGLDISGALVGALGVTAGW
jgi:MOSC domain-containing protein YiiM